MIGSSGWDLRWPLASSITIFNENLPFVVGHLQLVEIECDKIIHEIALHLTSKYVYFRPNNVERMAIATRWSRPGGQSSRPLSGGYEMMSAISTYQLNQQECDRLTGVEQVKCLV